MKNMNKRKIFFIKKITNYQKKRFNQKNIKIIYKNLLIKMIILKLNLNKVQKN